VSTPWWSVAAGLLAAAAVVAAWPLRTARRRLRGPRHFRPPVDLADVRRRLDDVARRRPRHLLVAGAGAAALVGLVAGGPVGAVLGGVYAALAGRAVLRHGARRRAAAARARSLDDLCALAADLRAGLPPAAADPVPDRRLADLTAAVWRLAERTGAPAADLVERIEADARAADRAAASAAAQAAGAQATALLLAALPLGGIALGYGIGVDPLAVLLHTALGAACAIGAVLLQGAGLLWADRLVTGPAR
jgi:tight adherence protein B